MKRIFFCLAMIPVTTAMAEHNALLPRPQQVQYGSGTLALQGLTVQFTSPPSTEDRFAAEQLASRLSALGQTKVEIKQGESSGRAIVLNRTAEGGALPADMESPGPDSRESYTLQVTPQGAEISGGRSAGVFYGVQTLLQRVEGAGAEAVLPEIAKLPSVKEAAMFGNGLHVVTADGPRATAEVRQLLDAGGYAVERIEKIVPSLEDVFVSLIEARDRADQPQEEVRG